MTLEKKVWDIIGGEDYENEKDEITTMMKKVEEMQKAPVKELEGESFKEALARRDDKISKLQQEITDKIYAERKRKIFKSLQ